ncbi:MJ0042-type zinc finger domain-containing protein [Hirschia baltica]|uniref:MJ0042 family finger-like protein n=1 Tax=Hirschia baltica (strain ATCC 49814 / DSM 5838 / IFAM 1418) TaxID=582402 RepID=C6XLN0_HIRBI|nr:MJ0042-type zinc finger domain-containing protein [Hirschia baltica]ACT57936.1 MJ0042 family finger-like protein [Hirschia baltica ATCC 49814]
MILICPSCQTRYFTSEAALGSSGRNVRCAACDHSWYAKPPETLEAASQSEEDTGLTRSQVERLRQKAVENATNRSGPHAELREKQAKRRSRNRVLAASAAWVVSGITFVGVASGAVNYRQEVVEFWPKSASVYAMMGMEVNRFGLEFGELSAHRSFDGTTPILTITGSASNISDRHRASPIVRISLRNEHGEIVQVERVNLLDNVVAPGQTSSFMAHIVSPPMDSFDLQANFESPQKAVDGFEDHYSAPVDSEPHSTNEEHGDAAGEHDVNDHEATSHDGDSHDTPASNSADHGTTDEHH